MFNEVLAQVKDVAGYLWQKGWAEANAGNLSIDVTDSFNFSESEHVASASSSLNTSLDYSSIAGRSILITGSGCRFRDISKEPESGMCIIHLSDYGKAYQIFKRKFSETDVKPTSEIATHLRLHEHFAKSGSLNKVVLHTHPTELVALSHMKKYWDEKKFNSVLLGMLPEVKVILPEGAGLVDYALPGSEKLAEGTLEKLIKGYRIIMWQKHGCLAVSDNPLSAFDMIDILNKGAQVLLACLDAGEIPQGLSKDELDELAVAFNLKC